MSTLDINEKVIVHLKRKYNGPMGRYNFVDGVSQEPVDIRFALKLGAAMGASTDDGRSLHPATWWKNAALGSRGSKGEPVRKGMQRTDELVEKNDEAVGFVEPSDELPVAETYTREELEAIADDAGIHGLRDIGQEHGVKARSINDLIDGILKRQG